MWYSYARKYGNMVTKSWEMEEPLRGHQPMTRKESACERQFFVTQQGIPMVDSGFDCHSKASQIHLVSR